MLMVIRMLRQNVQPGCYRTILLYFQKVLVVPYENIKRGSKVSVAVVNRDILDGYRFVGEAILHESGDLYEQSATMSVKMGMPKPKAVVVINIAEIHTLKPVPTAGKKID